MVRGRAFGVLLLACSFFAACADILGIDDGKPRDYDSSVADSSPLEATTLPDASKDVIVADVAIDVPVSPLVCGTSTCNAFTEACCRMGSFTQADAESFACVDSGAQCMGGLLVTCDESANCAALGHPGDVCCGTLPADGGSIATSTTCVAPNACNGVVMCQPGDDEMCKFDAGQTCKPSVSTILGWTICKT